MKIVAICCILSTLCLQFFCKNLCNKLRVWDIKVILEIDNDLVIYPYSKRYVLDRIEFEHNFAHINGTKLTNSCAKFNKFKRCQSFRKKQFKVSNRILLKYVAIARRRPKYDIKISSLQSLKYVSLRKNSIGDVEERTFTNLPNLKKLQLSNNRISEIKMWCNNCSALNTIQLNHNRLHKLSSDAFIEIKAKSIANLILNNNLIELIEDGALDHLRRIGILNLAHNKLKKLPDNFLRNLTSGYSLDLSFNGLECIPKHILYKFKYVNLDGNPIIYNCIFNVAPDDVKL